MIEADVAKFQILQLKYCMKLEIRTGMKHSRMRSVVAKVKKLYGLKGNKQRVYEQFCQIYNLET